MNQTGGPGFSPAGLIAFGEIMARIAPQRVCSNAEAYVG
jgi:hypothetical protein